MITTDKTKPDWAGEDFLSKIVNILINIKPIYALMKQQARQVLIKTAEKNGVLWRKNCQDLDRPEVKNLLTEITNSEINYPEYYQQPFHAYDQGNLCWQAAFEAEPATRAMGLRVWPKEKIDWQTAESRLRGSFHQILAEYGPSDVHRILDIGCSVGISAFTLQKFYETKLGKKIETIGLDLSPYMLAVAKYRDSKQQITWQHGLAENTGYSDESFDLVTLQFILHELPQEATRQIFQEIFRILRPGSYLAIVDNNPRSTVIQNLPPALFILMKSTEPWSDQYYTFDVENCLQEVGFQHRVTAPSDPRHRTIIAIKP
jgi:ubiquinone/menaquinone biosynthesis C-methylase UbiE